MAEKRLLDGKRILVVDDEPDVLESLEELLSMCEVVKASTFEEARELLETQYFDIVILDIMGVDGYQLLEIAIRNDMVAVMLTGHALTVEDTVKSFKQGAASYVPKDEMPKIALFLEDILEAREEGRSIWWRWFDRLGAYYDKKFGADWRNADSEFWESFRQKEI